MSKLEGMKDKLEVVYVWQLRYYLASLAVYVKRLYPNR